MVATVGAGAAIWALGLACCFSLGIVDTLDNITTMYLLPIGGLGIAVLAGWFMKAEDQLAGFQGVPGGRIVGIGWLWTIRLVTPVLVAAVIAYKVGLIPSSAAPEPEGELPVQEHEE